MRLFICLLLTSVSFSQNTTEFSKNEAKNLLAICNSFSFEELYGTDKAIIPDGYLKTHTSPVIGLDNIFQVYEKENVGIIHFRGSTSKTSSWIENFYSAMIPAKGIIYIEKKEIPYQFINDTSAAVHSGYALAVLLLQKEIINQIQNLNKKGIYTIITTGHSQGGALALLTRAYLEQLPNSVLSRKNKFKTYAFANPMIGNKSFATLFNNSYQKTAFSIINPEDIIPKTPMHYEDEEKLLSKEKFKNWIFGDETLDLRKLGSDLLLRGIKDGLSSYVSTSNKFIERVISFTHVDIEMPPYSKDINYFKVGEIYELTPFEYPQIEINTSGMTENEVSKLTKSENGKYYQKEPSFFQHNPYNYYVGFIKENFPADYIQLQKKYLDENL